MPSKEKEIYLLTHQIRTLFNNMARFVDALHEDSGVSVGERAVLELLTGAARTVPDMARERNVTRQHIQMIVNQLLEKGLAETQDNPAHKRSQLIAATSQGTGAFDAMRVAEQGELRKIGGAIEAADLAVARQVLSDLDTSFSALTAAQLAKRKDV